MSTFVSIPEWVEKRKAMIKHKVMRCDVSPVLTIVKAGNVGGVGLLTRLALLGNVVKLHKMH